MRFRLLGWSKFSSHRPHHPLTPEKDTHLPTNGTWTIYKQVYFCHFLSIYIKQCHGLPVSKDENLNSLHQLASGFIPKALGCKLGSKMVLLEGHRDTAEEGTSTAPLLVLAMSTTTLRTTSTWMGQKGGISEWQCKVPRNLAIMSYPPIFEECKPGHLSFKVILINHTWNKSCLFRL